MMIFLLAFIAIILFFYFQQETSNRNIETFQRSREKYEQLLQQLRKQDEEMKSKEGNES